MQDNAFIEISFDYDSRQKDTKRTLYIKRIPALITKEDINKAFRGYQLETIQLLNVVVQMSLSARTTIAALAD